MSEYNAALFWEVETDPNPFFARESKAPAPDLWEEMLADGLCTETTGLPVPVTALSTRAVECSTAQVVPTKTAQDNKAAMQPHATSTMEVQKADTAIKRPHQAMIGTQTEDMDELCKPEKTKTSLETNPSPAPEMAD